MNALLFLSISALFVGPLLHRLFARVPQALAFLEGVVLSSVGTLLFFHVLPEAIEAIGAWAAIPIAIGLAGPWMLERAIGLQPSKVHAGFLVLMLLGLIVHSAMDGVGLASHNASLGLAIVLHQLPVGLVVWWLVRPKNGPRGAVAILVIISVSTIAGYMLGDRFLSDADSATSAVIEALIGGSLVHVVLHSSEHQGESHPASEAIGFVVGVALLYFGLHLDASLAPFGQKFLRLALHCAPAMVIGCTAAGMIGTRVYKSEARERAASVLSSPWLGIEAAFISIALLGFPLLIVRVVAVGAMALLLKKLTHSHEHHESEAAPVDGLSRIRAVFRFAFASSIERSAGWVLVGFALAVIVGSFGIGPMLSRLPSGLDVLVLALVGVVLPVSAIGATPLAAALIAAGVSPGAGLAFLLTVPMIQMLARSGDRLPKRLLVGVVLCIVAVAIGSIVNLFARAAIESLPQLDERSDNVFAWGSLFILLGALLSAFFRVGPRALIAGMTVQNGHSHAHAH